MSKQRHQIRSEPPSSVAVLKLWADDVEARREAETGRRCDLCHQPIKRNQSYMPDADPKRGRHQLCARLMQHERAYFRPLRVTAAGEVIML